MSMPSTEWRENVGPDEPVRFAKEADIVGRIQQNRSQHYGHHGRAFHRKQLLAVRASFEVLRDLPEYAAHGVFGQAKSHEAWVRLSNGSFDVETDQVLDVRGFAIKVFGVDGPDARDGSPARYQDFLLIPQDPFGLTSWQFTLGEQSQADGVAPTEEFLQRLRFDGFACTTFHAPLPIKVGPYAARARLVPPLGQEVDPHAEQDWGADLHRRLPLTYQFQLQFFRDEDRTPIEDTSKVWPEDIAPYVPVATLEIPEQLLDPGLASKIEKISFAPWNALAEHRPLGEVNRARRVVMDASVECRGGSYTVPGAS